MKINGRATVIGCLALAAVVAWNGAEVIGQESSSAGAEAIGAAVETATISDAEPRAVLGSGYFASDEAASVDIASLVTAENAVARTTGGGDSHDVSSESVTTLEKVDILDGIVTADLVMAISSSAIHGTTVDSNAEGSALSNLVVNGTPVSSDVAPNTRIDVPGVGTVVLNEQVTSGDGVDSTGLTVNMIHVILEDDLTGEKTGDIIVGSASSEVTSG